MKRAGVLSICGVLFIALSACPSAAGRPAAEPTSHLASCRGLTAHAVKVTRLRSNFGCERAQTILRGLLKSGVPGLPRKTKQARKWGCKRSGKDRACTWYRSRRQTPRRIKFRAAAISKTITKGTPQPQPPPPPPVVDPVQQCIGIWNADGLNRVQYGTHFYSDHNIRDAWVFTIPNPFNPAVVRCAVVFAVPPSDPYPNEFGTDGEVRNSSGTGWQFMNSVPELGNPIEVQQQAPQNVNASLQPDGTLQRKG